MLLQLVIRDVLLIDRVELAFQPGLNVLTGETGAGKSILLDSLGFVLGWRGRADVVRQGAEQGEVTAEFALSADHPAQAILDEAGLPGGDMLLLRRVAGRDGRKRAWVNDRPVSGEVLRSLSDVLVELHGQHDDRGLLDARGHMGLLDSFAQNDAQLEATRAAWRQLASLRSAIAKALAAQDAAARDKDFLTHAVAELDQFAPETGEDEALDTRRRLMQAAQRIREDVAKAANAMSHEGAEGAMGDALRWLEDVAPKAEGLLDGAIDALGRALNELGEAQSEVERALDRLLADPDDLDLVEERLFALRALARKHQVAPNDLAGLADELRARLGAITSGAENIARLKADAIRAEEAFQAQAGALTAARQKAAKKLDAAMAAELAPLKLEQARFSTAIGEATAGPDGVDSVSFVVATNPGAPAGPIDRIASGGELSRFLLALKVCLSARSSGLTMIFDEIDRGVGGATADAVGRRLAAVAARNQVLVVTHSPQVAAQGAHHWRVEKAVQKGQTETRVRPLDAPERVDEIARMLAGDSITDAARAAAQSLLASRTAS
ncbi:DNA repair protein RecN [Abyssibius alkaniclasticus]|uniref:DNA repair protein RecN n=1 Tax=Abyssibius alkaniclasticus TaxID=2881234 RepID=UPI0040582A8C